MSFVQEPLNIVIADDHKIFLEGLTSLLEDLKEIKIIATAADGQEVLEILEKNKVDVVITDINMPGMDGMKLTKEIKKKYPDIKILALTMHNEASIISTMIKNGISGYLLKDTGKEELLDAIIAVAAGETFFSNEVKSTLLSGKKRSTSSRPDLSDREIDILKLIAAEFTQQQIADKLFISPHTVIFHRRKLLHKFDVKNTAGLIKAAADKGFLD